MLSPVEIATLAAFADDYRTLEEVKASLDRQGLAEPEETGRAVAWLHGEGLIVCANLGRRIFRPTSLGELALRPCMTAGVPGRRRNFTVVGADS